MKVLITGATGFIGSALTAFLLQNNCTVHYVTTSKQKINNTNKNYQGFLWNPEKNTIDNNCLIGVDVIVNLAGHSINCKWNAYNKNQILQSRLSSSNTLFKALKETNHQVNYIINASAIGIYKSSEDFIFTEESQDFGNDFLAMVCKQWEQANKNFETLGIANAFVRFGLILSKKHGVLNELDKVVSKGIGANLGNGKQWMSWVHYHDVVQILYKLITTQKPGVFNVVAPNAVQQNDFLKTLANQLNKPFWLPNIPNFLVKILMGEKAALVLSSQHVKPENIIKLGYTFKYVSLQDALKNLYSL
ncbi:TIGR01777 family oxidoreductase [Myroides sp. JBRI-B21084]|uniref:TIGR01777 family oxidoreductase n=1 Tax=Myroides sp. JBRI-B21084 TaxID=3119977 RepID=UPI0026E19F68|nr:TIGR01777 family oxidoreductase [Paenimyroides cloacae]WKW47357.1 TIGR01777 family oxidoreductase [Paenimyroides cloacae]